MRYDKKIAVIAGSIVFVIIGIAASNPPEEKYKNLKVLPKKITPETLDKVMDEFEKALGVGCEFCHVKSPADTTVCDLAGQEDPEKNSGRNIMGSSHKSNTG